MGKSRNAYRVLVGRPEGKRHLGRPKHRWEDNIKMDLREVGYVDRDWINLAQDRDQWRVYVREGNEPPGSLKAMDPSKAFCYVCDCFTLPRQRHDITSLVRHGYKTYFEFPFSDQDKKWALQHLKFRALVITSANRRDQPRIVPVPGGLTYCALPTAVCHKMKSKIIVIFRNVDSEILTEISIFIITSLELLVFDMPTFQTIMFTGWTGLHRVLVSIPLSTFETNWTGDYREIRPTSIVQLSAILQEEWRRIPVDILHKLVENIPDGVADVIATRGGTTTF
ncbi:hypothetical protein ANN_25008 [Periplaneta americana]|uniref:Uncharacterized protein n=1 Tax=Periplaneta americana TaxID=6978 RepID=A0ABQ8S0C1_PERAM|nr:hypothetical protein ANN_25008 [Periplaneta americana]